MIEVTRNDGGGISIAGEATIHEVEDLHRQMVAVLNEPPARPVIDLSRLIDMDAAGAQLLLVLKKHESFALESCPEALVERLGRVGLASLLFG